MMYFCVIDASTVPVSTFSLPVSSSSLPGAPVTQETPVVWPWILAGALGGCFLLVGLLILVIIIIGVRARKRKTYTVSGQSVSQRNTPSSSMASSKFNTALG